ncbi:4-aminobutyrate transaminase [Type-D symbiont of Plautia stali]|uniref:4-aminobutyrate transaminase n=1 Tax=Type-D symbiont of Plautia stali TaxID=1560356 RepID=UPI00073EBEE3|nr:4-aminobutyrate transaminase [Type-D symbiont of Plautia stali]
MKNSEFNQRRLQATPRGVGVMCDFYAQQADNATLTDVEGAEYIDFAAGIAVLNTGHRHAKVVEAIEKQLAQFTHTAYQIVPYESYVGLAEKINELTPIQGETKTAFFTTGAEAVENAIKIARCHTGRPGVIAFGGAFHGRTYMTMALTGKVKPYKTGFGPFPGSVFHAAYPSDARGISVQESIRSLESLFQCDIDPQQVAAIIFEPVQGEGGFNVAPVEFVSTLRAICDQHGIVLIADEVQSGFARTGKMFAMQHYVHQADLMTMAKSLAGGMPLSAVAGKTAIMDSPLPGGLGGTYAGNPLSIAAAHAVIDVINEEQLCERAVHLGGKLRAVLEEAQEVCPALADVRGVGSMMAAEFSDPASGKPSAEAAQAVQKHALAQGLLLLTCGQHGNIIRFLYPLTIPEAQFDKALAIVKNALEHIS